MDLSKLGRPIVGSSEEAIGKREDIYSVYESCLQSLESLPLPTSFSGSPEYNFWWERFFSRCCGCFYGSFQETIKARKKTPDPKLCLIAFRSWAKYWGSSQGASIDTTSQAAIGKRNQRRLVWKSYYNLLSEILRLNLTYYPASSTPSLQVSEKPVPENQRSLQFLELKKVEAVYEGILLRDVSFPEASKVNYEIDEWVNTVMSNWSILCSAEWQAQDLGEPGKAGISRGALEILYRAATRSFHSTSVLRNLFIVHASVAEFDLAEKALDSYLDIVTKGKARVEKSGHAEPSLDSDEVMLQTIAAGVGMLCDSGKRALVQKSTILAKTLEQWLTKHNTSSTSVSEPNTGPTRVPIASSVLTSVYRAIGTSKASWAKLTYETAIRARLQTEAVDNLRIALQCDHAAEEDPSLLYALALLLAETRDIEGAVAAVKQALASESRTFTEPIDQQSLVEDLKAIVTRTAPLTECWHLLALLLSSRQEFETAEVACEAVLQQFESSGEQPKRLSNLDSQMSYFEKRQVIEAKITSMRLVDINEGPEVAVNTSGELLKLYTRFFDNPTAKPSPLTKTDQPPSTAISGTRSFRGSIRGSFFGRNKDTKPSGRDSAAALSLRARRMSDDTTRPPTISEHEDLSKPQPASSSNHEVGRRSSGKLQKRASKRSIKRRTVSPARNQVQEIPQTTVTPARDLPSRDASARENPPMEPSIKERPNDVSSKDVELSKQQTSNTANEEGLANGNQVNGLQSRLRPDTAMSYDPSEVGIAVSHDLRASVTAQFNALSSTTPIPSLDLQSETNRDSQPENDFSYHPSTTREALSFTPTPLFSEQDLHRFSLSLLQKIWLFIAGLYRRANMLEDARGAIDEAFKQAKLVESTVVAKSPASVKRFEEPAWGGVRSVEEVWADVWAELGNLHVAEGDPYEAMIKFEGALSHYVDHAGATVGLANILLDIYSQKIPIQPKEPSLAGEQKPKTIENETTLPVFSKFSGSQTSGSGSGGVDRASAIVDGEVHEEPHSVPSPNSNPWSEDPKALDRLAARDRAYGLLSALTKLGRGWDDSEAWFALARSYEESGQVEKAKEVLWWVVELEEKRPVRHWRCLGEGYKLRR